MHHWEETWCVCENSFHRFNSTWHWITFLWNLSRLSHDFSFLTQFDFSPPHLLICLGLFQIQLTRNHFSSKTPSLPLGSSLLWDPLLHTLLTLLSYLLLSLCTECDCISQGLNCPQVQETICWQIWLAFMTLSPLVGIPDSLRNIAFSQRAWGISEGRDGLGQLLNFIPRQFEKWLVSKERSLDWYTVIVFASISWGDIWQEQPSANLGKQWLCLKLWSQQHPRQNRWDGRLAPLGLSTIVSRPSKITPKWHKWNRANRSTGQSSLCYSLGFILGLDWV